ncbi:protein Mis18-alpha [Embiotoca jacksoni]|uniref:protein Mis18-alpha n=1 Tax=Embiotoca jacksoni TaxID=100190 RepID=UPI0037044528
MSTKTKSEGKQRKKNVNITFEASSVDFNTTTLEEKLVSQTSADEDSDDRPAIFICGKCKLIVGDSVSWSGSEDGLNQIKLKRVTGNILIGKESRLFEASKRSLCLIMDLFCRGCHSVLGMFYTSTPKSMDHKRCSFYLNVADIESYELGSAKQMLAAEGPKEQPVTLEYRGIVEQELMEMKMLVMSMAQRLDEIEGDLREESDEASK